MDWECGGRDKATCERLIERLTRWRTRLSCTDDDAVYDALPVGRRSSGKNETHGIERDNAQQRHWLARFRRRSIVVSKAKCRVDVRLARFAGNNRIDDLISRLTQKTLLTSGPFESNSIWDGWRSHRMLATMKERSPIVRL